MSDDVRFDRDKMMDEVARVLTRHMCVPVAHIRSSCEQSPTNPDHLVIDMTFVGTRGRMWTAVDRMREAVDERHE